MKLYKQLLASFGSIAFAMLSMPLLTETIVSWTSPTDGSSYVVGSSVAPAATARGIGSVGDGLYLALVLDSSGSMTKGAVARDEFIGANHTAAWSQQMIEFSNSDSPGISAINATDAVSAGVDAMHSVALPGAAVSTLQNIAADLTLYGTEDNASVPEPAALSLLGLGMLGLYGVYRRKR